LGPSQSGSCGSKQGDKVPGYAGHGRNTVAKEVLNELHNFDRPRIINSDDDGVSDKSRNVF
jgi:hypothetical protein